MHVRVRCRELFEDLWTAQAYGLLEAVCAGAVRKSRSCAPKFLNGANLIGDLEVISTGVQPLLLPLGRMHAQPLCPVL